MIKAAKKVLDGDGEGQPHPTLEEQTCFWGPVVRAAVAEDLPCDAVRSRPVLRDIWKPVSEGEVINIRLLSASAPGINGMTVKR